MADVDVALNTRLDAYAGLSALVGSRNYLMRLPDKPKLPANTIQRIGRVPFHAMGSDSTAVEAHYQVDSWAEDPKTARDVAAQVVAALKRHRSTIGGVVINDIFIENQYEDFDEGLGQRGGYRVITEIVVYHEEI